MGYKPDWQNQSAKKPAGYKCAPGMQSRELFHGAKPAVMKYADGGAAEADTSAVFKDTVTHSDSGNEPIKETASAAPAAPAKFGDAFKEARASGAKTFEWNGKSYTTQVKEDVKPAAKKPSFDVEDGTFMDTKSPVAKRAAADRADEDKIRNASGGGKFVQGATPSRQSTPTVDTRTKEEKIKAAKGGKFVQGRTPE